jgi:ParB family chromosome partitioning protein
MEIKTIELSKITENTWNPNVMKDSKFAALADHVKKGGMVQPILVRPITINETAMNDFEKEVLGKIPLPEYEIIDGAHRFRASKQAGLSEITCVIVPMTDEQAKKATIAMNSIKGYMQDIQLAALIDQLQKNTTLEILAAQLAFEEKELKNYLKLLEAPQDFSELVKQPEDYSITMTFVVSAKKEKTILDALQKTGFDSKGEALAVISKAYLEGK